MFLLKIKQFKANIHITPARSVLVILSSALLAFGIYNIHSLSGVTEGGILGLILLLQYWFSVSPAVSSFIMNVLCYAFGFKVMGKDFLIYSFLSSAGFSVSYKVCEMFDPLWPHLAHMPFLAAILGAVFVGVSVGICVRAGGAPSGDDALAMGISQLAHINIRWVYLVLDLVVLALSLTYLPVQRIAYSLLSVILSGQIVGWMQFDLKRLSKRSESKPLKQS